MLHVVLYQPEIPPNTGNIARQCVGMNACLHVIGPIDMDLSSSAVKRAGLDYWDQLDLTFHKDSDAFLEWMGDRQPWLVSKHGQLRYDRADFMDGDILIFGNEITGLPEKWLSRWKSRTVFVPMPGNIRSYNLANTASIILAQASLRAGMYDMDL
jgi:tRNA (cytidine/uridine-2'-O-)-methyltransferase